MDRVWDVLIVGAGPASWSAATFLVRSGLSVLVVGEDEKSGLADAADVRNFPGFPDGISGRTLLDRFIEQAQKQGAEYHHEEVVHTEGQDGKFLVRTTSRKEFYGKNLVLAHGANYIKADLPGEKEYIGRGVHYCALCDGPVYKNLDVVVLGNSNLAAEEAAELSDYVKSARMVSHSPKFNLSPEYEKLLDGKKIERVVKRAKKISGDASKANSILLDDGGEFKFDGLFVSLGVASSKNFAQKLGLELNGDFVKVDGNMRTSVPGVWAVGMARGGVNQIVKSVGDGAVAAVDIIKAVKKLPNYIDHT